jgi:hypothetical protein
MPVGGFPPTDTDRVLPAQADGGRLIGAMRRAHQFEPGKYVTVAEAAQRVGRAKKTLLNWIADGKLRGAQGLLTQTYILFRKFIPVCSLFFGRNWPLSPCLSTAPAHPARCKREFPAGLPLTVVSGKLLTHLLCHS